MTADLERERDYWKRLAESHGPCICNTGPWTDGPDEYCPQHGRRYDDLLDRLATANGRADAAEGALSQVEALAKSQAIACQRQFRADHARNWLDVLSIIEHARVPDGSQD